MSTSDSAGAMPAPPTAPTATPAPVLAASAPEASPARLGEARLTDGELARRLVSTMLVCDPWIDNHPRFHVQPLIMTPEFWREMQEVAERTGMIYDELTRQVLEEPALLDSFYRMLPAQKRMWLSSGGWWHGFARLDAFWCEGGRWQVCEFNADTPSGQSDIVACSRVFADTHSELVDVNASYLDELWELTLRMFEMHVTDARPPRTVGIVYPTELPEDILLIRTYEAMYAERGMKVVRGSPFNIVPAPDGRPSMFGTPLDVIIRHYKTDWWGEREPVWTDAPAFPDSEPLPSLDFLLQSEQAGRCVVINPFGSMVAQDKRSIAFFWERLDHFSPAAREAIRELIPETRRIESLGRERLVAERADWVLKSDYGCEGEEVVIGAQETDASWLSYLDALVPGRWVAQRFFRITALPSGHIPNYGVYLMGGRASGVYVRVHPATELTDITSMVATPLVEVHDTPAPSGNPSQSGR